MTVKVPSKLTLEEITRCFQDVWASIRMLDRSPTANLDLQGRRITNAGKSVYGGDYVTRDELKELERRIAALE